MKIKEITSFKNPIFKTLSLISTGRGVKKQKLTLISGPKQVKEVLRDFTSKCEGLLYSGREEPGVEAPEGVTLYRLSPELFKRLDLYGTGSPLLLVRIDPLIEWDEKNWPAGCTLFIPFQDPSNVGAVIRTAAAFGAARAVILKESANPFHHRSARVAGSAIFRIPLFHGPSINDLARVTGKVLVLNQDRGKILSNYRFPRVFGLVPGLEGPGLPDNLNKLEALRIPMAPAVESLNVTVAAGIALYEWRRGRGRKNKKQH
ncbi:MAG: hypothetical protein JRG97_02455 [Deltaproteobacteria bacterium]|nr:hypothetical protein [Deltaproteobacteria bacterium]MBW2322383.1 hypothetical protein [Deltaproteobacteria bacterium]